jgi:hypothetical protein
MVMNPNPYYPPYPPQQQTVQKVAVPVWVIVLVCAGVVGLLGMIGLAFVAHHSPLLHRVGIVHSASYNQGYDMGRQLDASKWPDVQSAGYDARQACGVIQPFATMGHRPDDPGDWIDGCAAALHDRGMR